MKSYTDLEQSKKLAEILPLESADMSWYRPNIIYPYELHTKYRGHGVMADGSDDLIPAWSLSALLDVLPKEVEIEGQRYAPCLFPVQNKWLLKLWYNSNYTITSPIAIFSDNPVDACYEIIIKLYEQKLL